MQTAHLIVDALNIAHAWPETRNLLALGPDTVAERLSLRLLPIHDHEHIRLTLVFDASEPETRVEFPNPAQRTFARVWTRRGLSADGWIEQFAAAAENPSSLRVASRDAMVRETVYAAGAEVINPENLLAWTRRCEAALTRTLLHQQKKENRVFRNSPFDIL